MTNLVREWSGMHEVINKFPNGVLPERMDTLTTLFKIDLQVAHGFTFRTHLLSTLSSVMLKRRFSRSCVHSVYEKKYKNLSDSLLGFSEATYKSKLKVDPLKIFVFRISYNKTTILAYLSPLTN